MTMQQKARQRPGVDKRTLLKRTFWLLDPETASLDAVIPTIDQLRGVNSVQVDRNKDRLTVMFDARHLCS